MLNPMMMHPAIANAFRMQQHQQPSNLGQNMQPNKFPPILPNNMQMMQQNQALQTQQQQMLNNSKPPGQRNCEELASSFRLLMGPTFCFSFSTGRPIVKGGGIPNQFPHSIEFQQVQQQQQQQRKVPANMPPPSQQLSPQDHQRIAAMLRSQQQLHQVNQIHQFHPMMQQHQQAPHAILGSSHSGMHSHSSPPFRLSISERLLKSLIPF